MNLHGIIIHCDAINYYFSLCSMYSTDSSSYDDNSVNSDQIFVLSLPALVYFCMTMAMTSYVLFKWEWGIRSVSSIP